MYLYDVLVRSGLLIPVVVVVLMIAFRDILRDVFEIAVILLISVIVLVIMFWFITNTETERKIWIKEIQAIVTEQFNTKKQNRVIKNNEKQFKKTVYVRPSYDGTIILRSKTPATYTIKISGCNVRRDFLSKDKICSSGVHLEEGNQFFYNKKLYNSYSFQFPMAPMDKAVLIIKKGDHIEKRVVGQQTTTIQFENNESGEVLLSLNAPNNGETLYGLGWLVEIEKK